jgi:hypothetical protein
MAALAPSPCVFPRFWARPRAPRAPPRLCAAQNGRYRAALNHSRLLRSLGLLPFLLSPQLPITFPWAGAHLQATLARGRRGGAARLITVNATLKQPYLYGGAPCHVFFADPRASCSCAARNCRKTGARLLRAPVFTTRAAQNSHRRPRKQFYCQ